VFTVNIRRDANVSLQPPQYGVSSGQLPTAPSSLLFTQPIGNPFFHQVMEWTNPNMIPWFDTLQQGINAQPIGNQINIQNINTGGFLLPTSVNW
jgi:hypothetical protein